MSDDTSHQRFVDAQDDSRTYERALEELRAGRKRSHWMWFVFPQVAGLGRSGIAQHFALADVAEARAYLAHPVLGPRLLTCVDALLEQPSSDAAHVLGGIDAVKLRSSMTLFAAADPAEPRFRQVLDRFYGGVADEATTARL